MVHAERNPLSLTWPTARVVVYTQRAHLKAAEVTVNGEYALTSEGSDEYISNKTTFEPAPSTHG